MSLIEKSIQKIQDKISNKNEEIIELKKELNNLSNDKDFQKHKHFLINSILKDYQFPTTEKILLLQDKLNTINKFIGDKNIFMENFNSRQTEIQNELEFFLIKKSDLENTLQKYELDIRNASYNTCIKDNQIKPLFETKYDEQKIKLNKWQQRKGILIQNNDYIKKKKVIKNNLRRSDASIKYYYWKLVEVEQDKNEALKTLSIELQQKRLENIKNINAEIYKYIDLPVHKILNDNIYLDFRKKLRNINKTIDNKYNMCQLKNNLEKSLENYLNYFKEYDKLDVGHIKILDITNIYKKYKMAQLDLNDTIQILTEIKFKQHVLQDEMKQHINDKEYLEQQKSNILKQLTNYETTNQKIIETQLEERLKRYRIRQNTKIKKQENLIKSKIAKLEKDISIYENQIEKLGSLKIVSVS